MSTATNDTATAPAAQAGDIGSGARIEAAAAMMGRIGEFVADVPRFAFLPGSDRRLLATAAVPPEFIEQSNVAMTGEEALARPGADPLQLRDLVTFSFAYGPVADAMEAAAAIIRRSATEARAKAGAEALATYAIAQRLATRPETAHLSVLVDNMRRTLNLSSRFRTRRAKREAEQPAPTPTTIPTTPTTPTTPIPTTTRATMVTPISHP